jgi:hypothetical protein
MSPEAPAANRPQTPSDVKVRRDPAAVARVLGPLAKLFLRDAKREREATKEREGRRA